MTYQMLPQRVAAFFLSTMPPFRALPSPEATEAEQRAAYDFIRGIYETLYDDPSLLGLAPLPDDCLGPWQLQKEKAATVAKIRDMKKKTEAFLSLLHSLALPKEGASSALKPLDRKRLSRFGVRAEGTSVSFPEECARGLGLLARLSEREAPDFPNGKNSWLLFSRGVFDAKAPYTRELFRALLPPSDAVAFDLLLDFLEREGYQRVDHRPDGNPPSLDYVKSYGKADDPLKWAWAEKTHGGIELIYEEIREMPFLLTARLPYFAELLRHADEMNAQTRAFVLSTTKRCDNCRYCVQTDKTGTRPLAFIPVDGVPLCPLFCGFQYRFRSLTQCRAESLAGLLSFADRLFSKSLP